MRFSELKRAKSGSFREHFAVVGKDIVTKVDCKIVIPFNYLTHKLARVGESIFIASIFAIVVGGEYATCSACAQTEIRPESMTQVKDGEIEYLVFNFVAGQVVMPTEIFVDEDLAYEINKYFYTYGRVPPFVNYADLCVIMKYHKEYSGLSISSNNAPFEIATAKICRDKDNKFLSYRHTAMKFSPVVVPFKSVVYNATNTQSKILGNYLSDGITGALISPSEQVETVETLLRA